MRNALHLIVVLTAVILPMLAITPSMVHVVASADAAHSTIDGYGAVQTRIG